DGFGNFYPTALAAAASMDLRLHHPCLAAEFLGSTHRFLDAEAGDAAGRRNTISPEDFLCLVLVDFHHRPLPIGSAAGWHAGSARACIARRKGSRDRQLNGRRTSRPAGKRGKYTAKARATTPSRQCSETACESRHQRPVGSQLHAVDILVNRQLDEPIELRIATDVVAQSRRHMSKEPAAVLRLGLRPAVAVAIEQIQLHQSGKPLV